MPYSVQIFNKKGKIIYYFVLYFVQIYFSFSFRKSISILYREIAVFHSIPFISLSSPFSGPSGFNARAAASIPSCTEACSWQGGVPRL